MESEMHFLLEQGVVSTNDNALFLRIINRSLELGIFEDKKAIAHEFGVPYPTVDRWLAGTNAPHPAMRPLMYKTILELQK